MPASALVTCRLDLNNALLYGLPQHLLSDLQRSQNVAARIAIRQRQLLHITSVLMNLNWLPLKFCIEFKILLQVYRTVNNLSRSYITDIVKPRCAPRVLRSKSKRFLKVPETHHKWGYRAFSKAGPALWNSLPELLHSAPSLDSFNVAWRLTFLRRPLTPKYELCKCCDWSRTLHILLSWLGLCLFFMWL